MITNLVVIAAGLLCFLGACMLYERGKIRLGIPLDTKWKVPIASLKAIDTFAFGWLGLQFHYIFAVIFVLIAVIVTVVIMADIAKHAKPRGEKSMAMLV